MKRFAEIVNDFQALTIFAKPFIIDVLQGFKYDTESGQMLLKARNQTEVDFLMIRERKKTHTTKNKILKCQSEFICRYSYFYFFPRMLYKSISVALGWTVRKLKKQNN